MKWRKQFKDYPETWKSGRELINDEFIKEIDDLFDYKEAIQKMRQIYFDKGREYEKSLKRVFT